MNSIRKAPGPVAIPGLLSLSLEPAGPRDILLGLGQHQIHTGEPGSNGLDLFHLAQHCGWVCGKPERQDCFTDLLDGGCVCVRVWKTANQVIRLEAPLGSSSVHSPLRAG